MATYDYLTRLSVDIETAIIKEKKKQPKFNLNALINDLLNKHYKLEKK